MDRLSGKRIVILGLARQGRALARFAARVGAKVVVSDLRPSSDLGPALDELGDLDVTFVLGGHPPGLLEGTDLLAISGGVPADAPLVQTARKRGIPVTNDSLEFLRRAPAPVIGITGSAGKTTTTALTGAMGRAAGCATWVGGNIGNPLIAHLGEVSAEDFVVQELSSFQLELWSPEWGHERGSSPDVAAILNLTPNHLDRHGAMDVYAAAKGNILRYQEKDAVALLCADDSGAMSFVPLVQGRLRTYSAQGAVEDGAFLKDGQIWLRYGGKERHVCAVEEVRLPGKHNLLNVLAATTLADIRAVPVAAIREAINHFEGVPHRLEQVRTSDGVRWINDSIATAPERALAAIAAFDEPLILLAGGQDKEMVWDEWARTVNARAQHVILFGALGPALDERLARQAGGRQPGRSRVETLEEAVSTAASLARPGDVVLLAPGGTSYDAYRDFEERGEQFRELVREL